MHVCIILGSASAAVDELGATGASRLRCRRAVRQLWGPLLTPVQPRHYPRMAGKRGVGSDLEH